MKSLFVLICVTAPILHANSDMQEIDDRFAIDRTEVSIAEFTLFLKASNFIGQAERNGGGEVYAFGWGKKLGWTWQTPFGTEPDKRLPAMYLAYQEAEACCKWRGARLPTEAEWREAAYIERRLNSPSDFIQDQGYPYPTGNSPVGANCLADCGFTSSSSFSHLLERGIGPSLIGSTRQGVYGLYDRGANVWEWGDSGPDNLKVTVGGSWWHGKERMYQTDSALKPLERQRLSMSAFGARKICNQRARLGSCLTHFIATSVRIDAICGIRLNSCVKKYSRSDVFFSSTRKT